MNIVVVLRREVCRKVLHAAGLFQQESERRHACLLRYRLVIVNDFHAGAIRKLRGLIEDDGTINHRSLNSHVALPSLQYAVSTIYQPAASHARRQTGGSAG